MEKVDFRLNGKVALVTGASRGIGEAIAITLADYGAHCILVSRKEDALKRVAEKIASRGGKADVMACHVGDLKQIEALFQRSGSGSESLTSSSTTRPPIPISARCWAPTKGYGTRPLT